MESSPKLRRSPPLDVKANPVPVANREAEDTAATDGFPMTQQQAVFFEHPLYYTVNCAWVLNNIYIYNMSFKLVCDLL